MTEDLFCLQFNKMKVNIQTYFQTPDKISDRNYHLFCHKCEDTYFLQFDKIKANEQMMI